MNLIKNAVIFSAELPSRDLMLNHLAEIPFEPVGETFVSRAGFILNSATAELVTPIEGGYSFSVRLDEKLLPKSAVKRAVADAIQAYADEHELTVADLDEDLIGKLEEQTMSALIANALIKTTIVHCFYSEAAQFLIVPTTSKPMAQTVMSLLIKAVGAVKTSTIHVSNIKGGLTTRLKNYAENDFVDPTYAFGGFKLGASCLLKFKSDKAKFDMPDLTAAKSGLKEALEAKMEVELMELIHEGVAFKLTHDFKLRGIQFLNELTDDELEKLEDADSAYTWRLIAAIQLLQVVALIESICKLFEYKREPLTDAHIQKAQEAPAPEPEGEEVDALYDEAVAFVRESQRASISAVQRKLKLGYNRAARMIERMEMEGVVTAMKTNGSREVIR